MKVQLSEGAIRIRLDPVAFAAMRAGDAAALDLPLPGNGARLIVSAADGFAISHEGDETRIAVPHRDLADLAARLPCREGLRWETSASGRALSVVLEVDVRPERARLRPER